MEDSDEIIIFLIINGIKEINLNSNPHQINNQLLEHKHIIVPIIMKDRKNMLDEFILIKEGKDLLSWLGYEPSSFISLLLYFRNIYL